MNLVRARWETILLAVLALSLGVLLLQSEAVVSAEERLSREGHLFTAFRPLRIEQLEITAAVAVKESTQGRKVPSKEARKSHIVLSRGSPDDAHHYFIGADDDADDERVEADRAAIVDLLSTLEFAVWARTLDSGGLSDQKLGLSDPQLALTVEMENLSYQLVVGHRAPSPSNSVYARVTRNGAAVKTGVISRSLVEKLARDVQRFRGRLLLPHGRSKTSALAIHDGKQQLQLKKDDVGFRVARGQRVDRNASDRLFFQMARAGIEVYLSESQVKELESKEPSLRISQAPENGPRVEVLFAGPCPGHPDLTLARRTKPDELFGCVPASAVQGIRAALSKVVDRTLFPLETDEIDHVIVERGGHTLDIVRKDAAFQLISPSRRTVPLETGNEFIEALTSSAGDLVSDELNEAELAAMPSIGRVVAVGHPIDSDDTVRLTVELLQPTEHQTARESSKQLGQEDQTGLLARRLDDGAVLRLPTSLTWALLPTSPWYLDKQMLDRNAKDVVFAEVVADGVREAIAVRDEQLRLSVPKGRAPDDRFVRDLRKLLSQLTAERWLIPHPERPETPRVEVHFELQGKEERQELVVGRRVEGGYAAWSSLTEHPFVLSPRDVTTLETSLIDRSPAIFHPDSVQTLTIDWGALHYELERRGEELEVMGRRAPHLGPAIGRALDGLLPLASVRGGDAPERGVSRTVEPLELSGTLENQSGTPRTFRFVYRGVTVYQGVVTQLVEVRDAGFYYVPRGPVLELEELL